MSRARTTGRSKGDASIGGAIFGLVLGGAFFVAGVIGLINQITFTVHQATVMAQVVGEHVYNSTGKGGCGGPGYDPIVRFLDRQGHPVTATATNKRICTAPANNSLLKLNYDTTRPTHVQIPTASDWGTPIGSIGISLLPLAAGIAMTVEVIRRSIRKHQGAFAGRRRATVRKSR